MAEAKRDWTPGPWVADLGETYVIRDQGGGKLAQISFLGHGHRLGGRRPDPEPSANAHLIAASPDLYEALSAISEFWAYGLNKPEGAEPNPDDLARAEALGNMARKALAKARGQ